MAMKDLTSAERQRIYEEKVEPHILQAQKACGENEIGFIAIADMNQFGDISELAVATAFHSLAAHPSLSGAFALAKELPPMPVLVALQMMGAVQNSQDKVAEKTAKDAIERMMRDA